MGERNVVMSSSNLMQANVGRERCVDDVINRGTVLREGVVVPSIVSSSSVERVQERSMEGV